ncbi:MAG: PEP-CTERM sorting domain-containing protein [Candidatus Zixiibacteriota bacterium]|jgi:hypothetical protein
MVTYKRKEHGTLGKWVLAIIIFILGLTVTFASVDGFEFPKKSSTDTTRTVQESSPPAVQPPETTLPDQPQDSVPEPATLLLVAAGIGVAYIVRKKR